MKTTEQTMPYSDRAHNMAYSHITDTEKAWFIQELLFSMECQSHLMNPSEFAYQFSQIDKAAQNLFSASN